jgi:hypothetical protein
MLGRRFVTLFCVLVAGAIFAPGVGASTRQYSIMQDDGMVLAGTATADATLDEMQELGVDIVKVNATWRVVAPNPLSSERPDVDLADPANYDWASLSHAVEGIQARGMIPWLLITAPAPNWASSHLSQTRRPGIYKPNPVYFGSFAEALAKRFPSVNYWSVMNEPNFLLWLYPQIGSSNVSESAVHYRKLYVEARNGLDRGGAGADQIMFGELAPNALPPSRGGKATQPIRFLRDFFCLDSRLKSLRGAAARARGCTGKYKKVRATGFAYHPYTSADGPSKAPRHSDDAPITALKRIYRVLDRAYAYHRLSTRKIPLWNTEFGYQSNPPDIFWTPIRRVPEYINASEFLSYRDRRVRSYSQYQLHDEALGSGGTEQYGAFQAGLHFADGQPKPGPMAAYRLPLVVNSTRSDNRVTIWGGVRKVSQLPQVIELQSRSSGGEYTMMRTITLAPGQRYFSSSFARSGAKRRVYRSVVGPLVSNPTSVTRRVSAIPR